MPPASGLAPCVHVSPRLQSPLMMVGPRDLQTGSSCCLFNSKEEVAFSSPYLHQNEERSWNEDFTENLVCPETEPLEGTKSHQISAVCWTFWGSNSSTLLSLPSHSLPTLPSVRLICLLLDFFFSSPISLLPSFHHLSLFPLLLSKLSAIYFPGEADRRKWMSQQQEELGWNIRKDILTFRDRRKIEESIERLMSSSLDCVKYDNVMAIQRSVMGGNGLILRELLSKDPVLIVGG